jgi:SagB-type dehydrogenase family enzyme
MEKLGQEIVLSPGNEDLLWECFHENSKVGRYDNPLSNEEVLKRMSQLHESLPFTGYVRVDLPASLTPLKRPLDEVMTSRASADNMTACPVTLEQVATLLHYAYGVTRDNKGTGFPRPLRVVPSGGGLYPLEIFFHTVHLKDLPAGLYHYNPTKKALSLVRKGDGTDVIARAMLQPEIGRNASLMIFITAIFERSIFKYADRGYRYILLEAGHAAQNINLVANALDLGCRNIGGYFDRDIDRFLDLDGITHSSIYMMAIGMKDRSVT